MGRDIKVFVVVGMLVELFSRPDNPVLLHSIIMHERAPHRFVQTYVLHETTHCFLLHLFFAMWK